MLKSAFYSIKELKIYLCAVTLILIACNFSTEKKNIKSVKLVAEFQFFRLDKMQLFTTKDSMIIYKYINYVVYSLPYRYVSIIDDEVNSKIEIKNSYVIFKKFAKQGIALDSLNATTFKTINVDSFLIAKSLKTFPFYIANNDSLISKAPDILKGGTLEKHVYKFKRDQSYCDSMFYYYTPEKLHYNYSFSPKLDSLKKAKVYKINLIYNSYYDEKLKATIPRREFEFQLKDAPKNLDDEIIKLIDKEKINL